MSKKEFESINELPTPHEIEVGRLKRKLQKRDEKIKGLEKRIALMEKALSSRSLDLSYIRHELAKEITHSVQDALCNVRMIPVFPLGGEKKIVEVRVTDEKGQTKAK